MSQQGYLSNEGHQVTREEKKVLAGTLVGTTIEWYDFFIYAQAAGFVLAVLYFEPLGEENQTLAQLVAWASIGISFLFRPLGAILAGWIGDRFGRKVVLVITLMGMGGATFFVGVLPTHATWGLAAPILLIVLRVIQGLSAGGEWGGAALLSVEHAPRHKRGLFGMYPQIGVPLGMILATLFMFGLNAFLTEEQFLQWGWRVPFIFSFVLIVAAYMIRRRVEESPVFTEMKERKKESSAPLKELVTTHKKYTFLAALIFAANNAAGYLVIAFFAAYGAAELGMSRTETLIASLIGGVGWFYLHHVRRLGLRPDRTRADLPDRLRHHHRVGDPHVVPHRYRGGMDLRAGDRHSHHGAGPLIRPAVRTVCRDVPSLHPVLRGLHRIRLRLDHRWCIRSDDRPGDPRRNRPVLDDRPLHLSAGNHLVPGRLGSAEEAAGHQPAGRQ